MWPWAHVAAAYLVYAGVRWSRVRSIPVGSGTLAVALGALFPDVVDKPLAWYLHVLPSGRTLAHSLLIAGVVLTGFLVYAHWIERLRVAAPFALGYTVHIAGDAFEVVVVGQLADLYFLAWPLTTPPEYETIGALEQVRTQVLTPFFAFELAITLLAVALWWYHGRPGLGAIRGLFGEAKRTAS